MTVGSEFMPVFNMAFAGTTDAILRAGATPKFVDVNSMTWTMNPVLI